MKRKRSCVSYTAIDEPSSSLFVVVIDLAGFTFNLGPFIAKNTPYAIWWSWATEHISVVSVKQYDNDQNSDVFVCVCVLNVSMAALNKL